MRREANGRGHWVFLGPLHKSGYARICVDGRYTSAAQAVWWIVTGSWPRGRLYRVCRDGGVRCVKPGHHREGRPLARQRELRPPRPMKFDADTVREIRRLRAEGTTFRQLSERFAAPISTLHGVASRKSYTWIA